MWLGVADRMDQCFDVNIGAFIDRNFLSSICRVPTYLSVAAPECRTHQATSAHPLPSTRKRGEV